RRTRSPTNASRLGSTPRHRTPPLHLTPPTALRFSPPTRLPSPRSRWRQHSPPNSHTRYALKTTAQPVPSRGHPRSFKPRTVSLCPRPLSWARCTASSVSMTKLSASSSLCRSHRTDCVLRIRRQQGLTHALTTFAARLHGHPRAVGE